MPEGTDLISPQSIEIELPTRTVHGQKSRYLGPLYSHSHINEHRIEIAGFGERGPHVKDLSNSITYFRHEIRDSTSTADFTREDISAIIEKLTKIREKLRTDVQYRQGMEKLILAHEEAHRAHEVRFRMAKDFRDKNNIKRYELGISGEADDVLTRADKTIIAQDIYAETGATVEGLRHAESIDTKVREDFLLWRNSNSIAEMMLPVGNSGIDSHLQYTYDGVQYGMSVWVPEHFMADIMIASGDPELVKKIQTEQISFKEFKHIAYAAMKTALLDSASNMSMHVMDLTFALRIDQNLGESVSMYRRDIRLFAQLEGTAVDRD